MWEEANIRETGPRAGLIRDGVDMVKLQCSGDLGKISFLQVLYSADERMMLLLRNPSKSEKSDSQWSGD